jgi:hypothetical protein
VRLLVNISTTKHQIVTIVIPSIRHKVVPQFDGEVGEQQKTVGFCGRYIDLGTSPPATGLRHVLHQLPMSSELALPSPPGCTGIEGQHQKWGYFFLLVLLGLQLQGVLVLTALR